jgi:inner membrane protein YidH
MAPESIQEREARSRTGLANERTYLAWWRTGLTCFAVSLGVGRLLPAVSSGRTWPYVVVGVAFALQGLVLMALGHRRYRETRRAIEAGDPVPDDEAAIAFTAFAGMALAFATIAIVVAES